MDQNQRILQDDLHFFRVGHEVGRQVPAIELHALDDVERRLDRARFLDGDDAVLADLVHRFGNDPADGLVMVGGDGADLGDHLAADRLRLDFERARRWRRRPGRCRS